MELILAETNQKIKRQEEIVQLLSSQIKNLANLLKTEKSKLEEAKKEEKKGAKLVADLVAWLSGKGSEDFDSIIKHLTNIKPQQEAKSLPEPKIIEAEGEDGEDRLSCPPEKNSLPALPETKLEAEAAKAYEDIYGFPPRTPDQGKDTKPLADTPQPESLIAKAPQKTKNRRGRKTEIEQLKLPFSAPASAESEVESQATAALQAIEAKIKELFPNLSIAYTNDQKSVFLVMAHKENVVGRIEDDGADVYISGKRTMKEYGFTDEQINCLLEADTRPKF